MTALSLRNFRTKNTRICIPSTILQFQTLHFAIQKGSDFSITSVCGLVSTSNTNTPWCRVLLQKLTGLQLVKKFPAFLWNPKVHYRIHKRPPPVHVMGQPNPVHIPTSHLLEIHPNIIHPSTSRSPQWSLSLRFPHQDPIRPPLLTHMRHMPSPSHSSWFYHPYNIGWGVQMINQMYMWKCLNFRVKRFCNFKPLFNIITYSNSKNVGTCGTWNACLYQ